jgi:hypothetical protein
MGRILIAAILASGCVHWQEQVIKQAAFDHRCPEEQVKILRNTDDPNARTVDLMVCSKERRYRDVGGSRVFLWTDVTDESQASPAASK